MDLVCPKLKSHLHIEILDDRALLIGEGRAFTVHGAANLGVLSLVDGVRTCDEIVDDLMDAGIAAAEIYRAFIMLESNGHIEEASAILPVPVGAFWNSYGIDTAVAARRLADAVVRVSTIGNVSVAACNDMLAAMGVKTATPATAAADHVVDVVFVDDYLRAELADVNEQALSAGRSWLLARPAGLYPWVGPFFRPHETSCWQCLAQRLHRNRELEAFAMRESGRSEPYAVRAGLPSTMAAAQSMVATELVREIVLGGPSSLDGNLISFDPMAVDTQRHSVVRRPQCVACGDGSYRSDRAPQPVELRDIEKGFTADGGHRAVSPEATIERFEHHISPIVGITKGLISVAEDDSPLHVYLSGTNLASRHDDFDRLRRHLRSSCCGKGTTDAQARMSALGEALERYSGNFTGEEIHRTASLQDLGDRGIDPTDSMLYSKAQYADREMWNSRNRRLDMIPIDFDTTAEIAWTPLWSFTRSEFRYLPTSYCYYNYPSPAEQFYCLPDSNGCAAGNTVEEAILQGFMELVERDAVAVWWYNRLSRPGVDLDSFDDPYMREMQQYYDEQDRDLWVLDLTSDLEIPAFIAISRRRTGPVEDIIFAPAAHFDPRMGVLRALTELNQMVPGVGPAIDGKAGYAYDDPEAIDWWQTATLENQPYLASSRELPLTRLQDHSYDPTTNLRDDVMRCIDVVERRGLEFLVLDQTRPDIGLSVVKVVVPGLRHFWARYAPGRLFDVPVQMGWLETPTSEADLNPTSIFI